MRPWGVLPTLLFFFFTAPFAELLSLCLAHFACWFGPVRPQHGCTWRVLIARDCYIKGDRTPYKHPAINSAKLDNQQGCVMKGDTVRNAAPLDRPTPTFRKSSIANDSYQGTHAVEWSRRVV